MSVPEPWGVTLWRVEYRRAPTDLTNQATIFSEEFGAKSFAWMLLNNGVTMVRLERIEKARLEWLSAVFFEVPL